MRELGGYVDWDGCGFDEMSWVQDDIWSDEIQKGFWNEIDCFSG